MRKFTLALVAIAITCVASCSDNSRGREFAEGNPLFSDVGQHVLPDARHVELQCEITVSDIPKGTKEVRVWAPFPQDTPRQQLGETTLSHPTSYRPTIRYERRYNARYLYVSASSPLPESFKISYDAEVARQRIEQHFAADSGESMPAEEIRQRFTADLKQENLDTPPRADMTAEELQTWQKQVESDFEKRVADILIKPSAPAAQTDNDTEAVAAALDAAQQAAAKGGTPVAAAPSDDLAKARAIYDYVIYTMSPDNAVASTPRRIAKEVLDSGRGDSVDYALVTVALLRAAGIPSRVESGVLLGEDKTPDFVEVLRKGAWVRFLVGGRTWSACDPYAGDVSPDLREYMFRGLCANRLQLAVGPGGDFEEAPVTDPPTVLTDAIAEADGKPVPIRCIFHFRDVAGGKRP